MKRALILLLVVITFGFKAYSYNPPDEGMWIPMLIERLNYADMKKEGLQLTPEELYSVNHSSVKDAIVGLSNGNLTRGFFCSAEVVSPEGLILTNHHCAYPRIQDHSTVEHDYLEDGFWAKSEDQELPNEGMTASFLVRMDDVTNKVLAEVDTGMSERERSRAIDKVSGKLEKQNSEKGKYDVFVKSFFSGNKYYMFVYITYKDVRLVGAPPSDIGKFGGDKDNWMWPRHTGDFSMFRIYTAPDGSPAEYSEDNVPLDPEHFLPISIKGVEKNDFSMIWGYPGSTERYKTSWGVKQAMNKRNPTVVDIRDKKLDIMREAMNKDKEIDIMYASKYAHTANYWKYYKGQTLGLKKLNVYDKKKELEKKFRNWISKKESRKEKYEEALPLIKKGYEITDTTITPQKYLEEALFQGGSFIMKVYGYRNLYGKLKKYHEKDKIGWKFWKIFKESARDTSVLNPIVRGLRSQLDGQFENYDYQLEHDVFAALLKMYYENVPEKNMPSVMDKIEEKYESDVQAYADNLFKNSIFVKKERMKKFLDNPEYEVLAEDPGFEYAMSVINELREIYGPVREANTKISHGKRLFIQGLRKMNPDKKYYPNGNSTLRMTYGEVKDYYPKDAVYYDYYTTLEGVMEKKDQDSRKFDVPKKLVKLYKNKNYGRYAREDGTMPVCFITDNDITGGNSGSPVINGKGHLIGTAFDGNWEGMAGDIYFEPELQRTINVDARYILFIIDKLANADNLIEEMTIIKDKE